MIQLAARPVTPAALTDRGVLLLVDDEEDYRRAMSRQLNRAGYVALEAANGSEAVHRYAERFHEIAAVLLDLVMPVTDGRETLAMFRAFAPDLPIVICTGFEREDVLGPEPIEPGLGFLQKPFTIENLEEELARVSGR
jgi:CheY-like chemotaxis protein